MESLCLGALFFGVAGALLGAVFTGLWFSAHLVFGVAMLAEPQVTGIVLGCALISVIAGAVFGALNS